MNSFFPDINVWLALAVKEHFHHQSAVGWWEESSGEIAFCRMTQMGLLRLLTSSATMEGRPLSMAEAWTTFDVLASDPRVRFLGEPPLTEAAFRSRSTLPDSAPKLWMDLYLQAFAESAGATLLTFDKRLAARHPGSRLLV